MRVEITPSNVTAELMNVDIVEQLPSRELTFHRVAIPISRVFIDIGHHRELISMEPTVTLMESPFGSLNLELPQPSGQPVTQVNVVNFEGPDYVSKTAINPSGLLIGESRLGALATFNTAINVIARQQVGTDIIWLGDIVIEAYRVIVAAGAPEGVALRYMRPVRNVLYRETGAEVVLPLEAQFEF